MNPILTAKIKELISQGHTDTLQILRKLNERPVSVQNQTIARPQFASEYKLFQLLVPAIVTVEEMAAVTTGKIEYVAQKMVAMFNAAPLEQKITILALQGQLQLALLECEKVGSQMFNDPKFLQQTEVIQAPVEGQSFLEENDLEAPDESEIRGVR